MKTAVITGGNSGMGRAGAIVLATMGYRVIIHGRDEAKTQAAAEEIRSVSANDQVDYIVADISTIKGMKALVKSIKEKTDTIHALILSTGVILPKQIITEDGLEAGFAIQYLSRFAVTQLLMPELIKGNAHVVLNAAPVLKGAQIFFDDIALKNNFTMMRAMGQEMFANHLFTQEFAKRHPDNKVVMNILHVGIAKTEIMRETNIFLKLIVILFGKSPASLSKNMIYLATDDSVNFSGYFLTKPGKPEVKEKLAYDPAIAARLYDMSLDFVGVHEPVMS